MHTKNVDVLIIGGGPSGLAAAGFLSRTKRTVALYDSGLYRNANANHFNTVPGHEGDSPHEWRNRVRDQLVGKYSDTFTLVKNRVNKIEKVSDGFIGHPASGSSVHAKKVILAMGVEDKLTDVKGLQQVWGRQAVHCVFCSGTETAGQGVALLLTQASPINKLIVGSFVKKWRNLKNKPLYVLTNGQSAKEAGLDDGLIGAIDKLGAQWDERPIKEVKAASEHDPVNVCFEDGQSIAVPWIMTFAEQIRPSPHAIELLQSLDADVGSPHPLFGMISSMDNKDHAAPAMNPANPATLMKGVFWAGNTGNLIANVALSIASGQMAGTAADDEIAQAEMEA